MAPYLDPKSVAGKIPVAEMHVPLIVVGAGSAGLAAALEAARAGVKTMLVDENPVAGALMGLDVPLHFGQRMNAAVQNKERLVERLVDSNPGLAEAFELGIEVQLGTYAWGAFLNGPTVRTLQKPMLGLADEDRSWMVSFEHLIVAAGARDLGLSFAGWEKPGVMGVAGAMALIRRYKAFDGRRLVILGSGAPALEMALAALEGGLTVAALVEIEASVRGPADLREKLARHGVPLMTRHAISQARGATEVASAVLVRLDDAGAPIPSSEVEIACDSIVTAIGLVPNVELLDVLGCRLHFRSELGGYVPVIDDAGRTTQGCVRAIGDCAGVFEAKVLHPELAVAEGRRAGLAAAAELGAVGADAATALRQAIPSSDFDSPAAIHPYWQEWLRIEIAVGGWEVHVCQCEDVSRGDLVELRPPSYLKWGSSQMRGRTLKTLAQDGPVNQDQVKRLTRAGMGPCQGRRCREQVQMLLASATGVPVDQIPLASYRAPIRPLPLSVLWPHEETEAMREHWDIWFGIPTQFTPHWEMDPVSPAVPGAKQPSTPSGK
ncbi:MAG: FAD-dependent oxidoreductase [Proteobacteria bacterium]|nr:FAD-dependent oxidoreductase [Pseudomonadota bacterium]MBI3496373.1 FAD-dependent oxidoreductase [Pseudomonadota bacterium]